MIEQIKTILEKQLSVFNDEAIHGIDTAAAEIAGLMFSEKNKAFGEGFDKALALVKSLKKTKTNG